jgi:hypothetical protein
MHLVLDSMLLVWWFMGERVGEVGLFPLLETDADWRKVPGRDRRLRLEPLPTIWKAALAER